MPLALSRSIKRLLHPKFTLSFNCGVLSAQNEKTYYTETSFEVSVLLSSNLFILYILLVV